jgi:hypothetical protein
VAVFELIIIKMASEKYSGRIAVVGMAVRFNVK